MHNQIRLSYINNGIEFDFIYDVTNIAHRTRIMNTVVWATKNNIELYFLPVREESQVSVKQPA